MHLSSKNPIVLIRDNVISTVLPCLVSFSSSHIVGLVLCRDKGDCQMLNQLYPFPRENRLTRLQITLLLKSEEMTIEGRKMPIFTFKNSRRRTGKAAWSYVQRSLARTALGSVDVRPEVTWTYDHSSFEWY